MKQSEFVADSLANWAARDWPPRSAVSGSCARLEPLKVERHGDELWDAICGADAVWTYMAHGPFADRPRFLDWLRACESLSDPLYFTIQDRVSGRALGLLALMSIRPEVGVIEIGHILFSPALQRTRTATDAIYLAARLVFDGLGYRRLEWKCDGLNAASRRAASRFGFRFEGVFRQHMIVKGRNRDTAWHAILDSDWPAARSAFERWLSPENFDDSGAQRAKLRD